MGRPVVRHRRKSFNKVLGFILVVLLLLIATYVVWVGYNHTRDFLTTKLIKIEPASYGVVQKTLLFEGLLIREETVLSTTVGGKIEIVASEGERVRVGAVVTKIKTPDVNGKGGYVFTNIKAPKAGIVSYYTDGLESILAPENLEKIDFMAIKEEAKAKAKGTNKASGQEVKGGSPVAKIVNNLGPMYIVGEIEKSKVPLSKLESMKQIMVIPEKSDQLPLYLNVIDTVSSGDKSKVILEMNNFADEFLTRRTHTFTLVLDRHEGYVVPSEAIVSKEGKSGIYTIYKNSVRWQPIEIMGEVDGKIAISGLTPDSSYVVNPKYATEGQVIK